MAHSISDKNMQFTYLDMEILICCLWIRQCVVLQKATALPSLSYIPYIFFFYKSFMLPFLLYIGYNGNLPFYVKNNLILTSVTISLNWGLRFSVNRTLLSRIFLFYLRYSKVLQTLMLAGLSLPPRVGLEPTTTRLTAECSTIELSRIIYFLQITLLL